MNIVKKALLIILIHTIILIIQIMFPEIGLMNNFIGLSKSEAADVIQTWNLSKTEEDNVLATLKSDGSLIISGTGKMKDWMYNNEDVLKWHNKIKNINNLIIEEGITTIGQREFMYCENIKKVKLPSTIERIEMFAFDNCSNLEELEINSYFILEPSVFISCKIKKLIITDKVESINIDVFDDLNNLEEIELYPNNTFFKIKDGILYNYDITELIKCPSEKKEKVIIPNGVKTIGNSAFRRCEKIEEIVIPNSVETIERVAFSTCNSLRNITIPGSVKVIKETTFYSCEKLEEVILENGVEKIEYKGIESCENIKTIRIPSSLTLIDTGAFIGDSGIINFVVDKNNNNYCSENGILYNKDKTLLVRYTTGSTEESFTIPSHVNSIENKSFYGANNLKEIVLNNNITKIPDNAFFYCKNLTNVKMTKYVKKIEGSSFGRCESLESITIPEGVISMGSSAFWMCKQLKEVNFSGELVSIGSGTFRGCRSLTNITIPNTLNKIGEGVFTDVPGPVYYYMSNLAMRRYNGQNPKETIFIMMGSNLKLRIDMYKEKITEDNLNILQISPNTSYREILDNIQTNGSIEIIEKENVITDVTQKSKTGVSLKIVLDDESIIYRLAVKGDTNGDGQVDVLDVVSVNKHRLGKNLLVKEYLEAGDIIENEEVDIMDLIQINKFRLGKINL